MSHPLPSEVARLTEIADDLREAFVERAHRIDVAMEVDPAFGSPTSCASLARDLAMHTICASASRVGIDFRSVNGNGRELRTLTGNIDRRFRLLKAGRRANGDFIIQANNDSALAVRDDDSLFHGVPWVFAWTRTVDGLIDEVFVAEVRSFVEGSPGRLVLGPEMLLGGSGLPGGGFLPADEDLPGFEDEEGAGDGFGSA